MYLRLSELGLPKRNSTHAKQIAMASIEMIHLCSNFTMEHMPTIPLQIRVGVHSGKKNRQINIDFNPVKHDTQKGETKIK